MISAMKNRLLFLPALLLSLPLALAQAPSGPVSFAFDRNTFPLWNFTGAYQFSQQMVGIGSVAPLSFQVFITHDLTGRLSGSGTTIVTFGDEAAAANYSLNGAVSLSGNATRATFTVALAGSGLNIIAGQPHSFSVSLTYNLRVDPDPASSPAWIAPARGTPVRGSVRVSGLGDATVIPGDGFTVALPPGVDGAWSVNMDILPLNRLGGTATIVVDSSAAPDRAAYEPGTLTLDANIVGTFKPTLALSKVLLSGLPDSRPVSLELVFANGDIQPGRIAGRILGQTVSY